MEAYERNPRIPHMMLLRLPQSSSDLSARFQHCRVGITGKA